ncbi:MAG: glutamate 5-kinase [Chitinispirillales bacterium]|jgi:glutamate 5-kinase|nr:glutamate 5-kinase [Chitinispirillales bacterium]
MTLINREELKNIQLLVVKVGSKILVPQENHEHIARISSLVENICGLINDGINVILVTSGAVANGRVAIGLNQKPKSISLKQACAGVGQIELMNLYRTQFDKYSKPIGQILLSWDDLRNKRRYLNLRNTLFAMLENGIIPIINENDSVSVDEIKIGDNDTLAGQIALLTNADLFVALSDINGLYTDNPKTNPDAKHIPQFCFSTSVNASSEGTDVGTGGMVTKLRAAEMVAKAGITAIVGDGYNYDLLSVINHSSFGTLFCPQRERMNSRDRFIAFTNEVSGTICVDAGAVNAIKAGKSLLPAGILSVIGDFDEGDTVEIKIYEAVFAKGITDYSSKEILKIKGYKSSQIEQILGFYRCDFVVHRNNMVVL